MGARKSISNSFTVNTVEDGNTDTLKLTVPTLTIPCDSLGRSKSSGSKDCYVTMYVNGDAVAT